MKEAGGTDGGKMEEHTVRRSLGKLDPAAGLRLNTLGLNQSETLAWFRFDEQRQKRREDG